MNVLRSGRSTEISSRAHHWLIQESQKNPEQHLAAAGLH